MNISSQENLNKGFVTTIGLVSSRGSHGDNLMAAEWTYLLSYDPAIMSVHIGNRRVKATAENIKETGVFGISLAASHQNSLSSIAGGNSALTTDKIAALKELGFSFIRGTATDVLLSPDAVLLVECKLIKIEPIGDHTMFVGEVISAQEGSSSEPLLYSKKSYWKLGDPVIKPSDEEREGYKKVLSTHLKSQAS